MRCGAVLGVGLPKSQPFAGIKPTATVNTYLIFLTYCAPNIPIPSGYIFAD